MTASIVKSSVAQESWVGFKVAQVSFALPISVVREIINSGELSELPGAPALVKGVIERHGEVLPILDLRQRFGLGPDRGDPRKEKWILIEVRGRGVGLAVEQVTRVFRAPLADLRPPPELGTGEVVKGIRSIIKHDGQLTFILDVIDVDSLMVPIPIGSLMEPPSKRS